MAHNSTQPLCDSVAEGHIETTVGMTENNKSLVSESLNIFILIEHEFFIGVEAGELDNIKDTYATFTKAIVMLFHGSHNKSEVHSALIVAEDHLTIILEDSTHLDESFLRFVERAIKFIKRYLDRIGEWVKDNPLNDGEVAIVSATVSGDSIAVEEVSSIQWDGKFTELVELVLALLISGKISAETDAEFIRTIFRVFGVKKSLTEYYKALKKIEEKHPKDDDMPSRCKALRQLLEDTEKELQRRYIGRRA